MNATMRAATQRTYGSVDAIRISTVERPRPGPGEVLVEVRAAALSPGDRAMITGVPYVNRAAASGLLRPKHPIPGFDVAGVVEATGAAVTRFEIGDRVFGNASGSLAEYAVASQDQLSTIPASWTFVEAAAVPESGAAALQAVRSDRGVRSGDRVAIVGAGGGVGCYALQIAKAAGACVTAVCGTRMLTAVRALGADDVVDYTTGGLTEAGRRFDVIIDTAGVTPLRRLRSAMARHGRLVIVGADHRHRVSGGLGRWVRALLWSPLVPQQLRPFVARPVTHQHLAELVQLAERGAFRPCVDRSFPLAEVVDAMRYLDRRESPGKVVVACAPDVESLRTPIRPPMS